MGMIIRVAFNNQNWAGTCKNARGDKFAKCRDRVLDVGYALDESGKCTATCWESTLCVKYFWGNPIGNFGRRAKGTVFFVYPHTDNSLVLWGKSEVDRVEGDRIFFKEFKPMPPEKWVRNLRAEDILGVPWGNGTYRYLCKEQEDSLNSLIR